jgi:hypothetical protein
MTLPPKGSRETNFPVLPRARLSRNKAWFEDIVPVRARFVAVYVELLHVGIGNAFPFLLRFKPDPCLCLTPVLSRNVRGPTSRRCPGQQ